jgi:hypothetical protein
MALRGMALHCISPRLKPPGRLRFNARNAGATFMAVFALITGDK